MPRNPIEVNRHFGETFCLHLQALKVSIQETSMKKAASSALLSAWFFFVFLLDPEDGGDMFLHVGRLLSEYKALYVKR
jgi:hypothetical protein